MKHKEKIFILSLAAVLSLPGVPVYAQETQGPQDVRSGESQPTSSSIASITMNGTTTYYDSAEEVLKALTTMVDPTATVTLLQDVAVESFAVQSGNITLDGGKTLSINSPISVSGGTLTIKSGTLTSTGIVAVEVSGKGTIVIDGGTISNITVESGGTVTMNNGLLGTFTLHPGGTFYFNGGHYNSDVLHPGGQLIIKAPLPVLQVDSLTDTTVAVSCTFDPNQYGGIRYCLEDEQGNVVVDWQDSGTFTGLTPDTGYTIRAQMKGTTDFVKNRRYSGSDIAALSVSTIQHVNAAPVISAADRELVVGDTFDPMTGVTAADEEDGDLTASLCVTGNVDTSKAGVYEVTYSVTDSQGLTTSRTIKVTVKEKPASTKTETKNKQTPTSAQTNSTLWIGVLAAAAIALIGGIFVKLRRK